MKRRTKWVLAAGVVAVALGAATVGGIALLLRGPSSGRAVFNSAGNYLELRLEGEIPEAPSSDLNSLFERHPTSLRTVIESLDRAAADSKVTSVLVRVSFLDAGWGRVQELRDAILRFRKSGKPAYAYIEFCGNKEYYLATACSKVYALPTAILQVAGLSAEVTFFRKSLEKLGVEAQFEGVGKYKNAPNTFTESSFTEPHREQMSALVDSLYEQYVAAMATGRGKSPEEIRRLIDRGPYDAPGALRAGLVDTLVYRDEIQAKLGGALRLTPARYVRASRGFGFDRRPKVALVYAVGEIMPGESQSSALGGEAAGSDTVSGAIRDARTDDDVKAIVLRVDSPGGFGPAADVIRREVQLAQKVKPVVVSMGDLAASGGYYVTIGSSAIVAEPGTITGSIGVFSGKFSLRGLYDKLGVTKEIVTRGANASLFTSYRPWTAEERAKVRGQNVAFYEDFVRKVAEGRGKSYEDIDAIAQGRVWTGADALQRGLVDRLGGLGDAVAIAKEKAHIAKGQDVVLVTLPPKKGFLEMIWQRQDDDSVETALPRDLRSLLQWVRAMSPEGPMARLPFRIIVR
jgi:protease-4